MPRLLCVAYAVPWWVFYYVTQNSGGDQAYSRLSTTHGHITDCKLDSVVYAGVCVRVNVDLSCFGPNDLRLTVIEQ